MADKKNRAAAPPPAPVQTDDADKVADGITRRQFLRSGMFGTVGMVFASTGVGAGLMFWPAKVAGFGGKVPAPVKIQDLKPGDPPVKVREGKYWLSRLPDGVIALYWKCVHLGCTVPWNPAVQLFHCPCHGSIYDRTGQNVGGPAPRPLDYMALEIDEEGNIIVDTGNIKQRERHLPEHVTPVK